MLDTVPTFNLNLPEFLANPYPVYAALRAAMPVVNAGPLGWQILRQDDISALLHDPRFASAALNEALYDRFTPEELELVDGFRESMRHNMLTQDPPEHTRLRRLVSQAFTPRRVEALRGTIQQIIDDLLDGLQAGTQVDMMEALAFPLPARVIGEMMGVPPADLMKLKEWGDCGTDFLGNARTTPDSMGLAQRTHQSHVEQNAYFEDLVAQRRAAPSDDLICTLIAIEDQGDRLTHQELLSTCGLLFAAGHETTTNLIGNGLLALFRNPDQLQVWLDDPSVAPIAVEELVRYDSPVQFLYRVCLVETELRSQTIRPGELVMLHLGSGNRDPEAFSEPDRLDLRRHPRHYVSFGTGIHACLGGFLARLETEIALGTLLRRFPQIALVDEPLTWHRNPIFHGVERLPVTL